MEEILLINKIRHPHSTQIRKQMDLMTRYFKRAVTVIEVVGFIIAIIAITGLGERIDESCDRIDVSFFGYSIEMETDTFGCSPFIVFLYINLVFAMISFITIVIQTVILFLMETKMNTLDTLYRNQKLTELLIEKCCEPQKGFSE